jgi:hypothetical protein
MASFHAFDSDTSRRLLNMLREWERLPKYTEAQPKGPRARSSHLLKALTGSGGIGAATGGGTGPGSATCTVYGWTGSGLSLISRTLLVYNFTPTAVGASKVITIGLLDYGVWECILEPC